MDKRYFSDKVVKWYERNKRDLPWRETTDPYKIWLSEIILQQTRVAQGLPYYLKFVEKFPTVSALAAALEQDVLRLWQGLGYYTRARNLHKCASEVKNLHHGKFPSSFIELKKLRGIGDYTAAAIASIAFKENVAVVDGNVFRVLARVFGIHTDIATPEGKKVFTALANELVDKKRPDIYNQAVMEFGALHCTPKNPDCPSCVFQPACYAAQHGVQHNLPVKTKAKAARKRYFYYFVVKRGNSMLMKKRDGKDIWHGLFDFYLVEKTKPVNAAKLIAEHDGTLDLSAFTTVETSPVYKHVLSHQIIHATFTVLNGAKSKTQKLPPDLEFYSAQKIAALPKPVLISRFLSDHELL